MPLRALAKMTNGAISMGRVDGIVMEVQGFWVIGLVRVIFEAVKNVILNAQLENRLRKMCIRDSLLFCTVLTRLQAVGEKYLNSKGAQRS